MRPFHIRIRKHHVHALADIAARKQYLIKRARIDHLENRLERHVRRKSDEPDHAFVPQLFQFLVNLHAALRPDPLDSGTVDLHAVHIVRFQLAERRLHARPHRARRRYRDFRRNVHVIAYVLQCIAHNPFALAIHTRRVEIAYPLLIASAHHLRAP